MVRHTRPRVADGTCYGQTDLDVVETFPVEAERVIAALPQIARIVTSPLQRCQKLADRIGAHFDLPVAADRRLIELDFGCWENRSWFDIPRHELDAWAKDFYRARPHGGENVATLHARVSAIVAEVRNTATPTLLVTHAGVIRAARAVGTTAEDFATDIAYGEIVDLQTHEKASR